MASDMEFRECKKFVVGLTHKLENCVDMHKVLVSLVDNCIDNGGFAKEQELELKEYNDRIGKCISYFSNWEDWDNED